MRAGLLELNIERGEVKGLTRLPLLTPSDALDYKAAAIVYWHKMRVAVGQLPDAPSLDDWKADLIFMQTALPIVWPSHFERLALTGALQLTQQKLSPSPIVLPPVGGHWHMYEEPLCEVKIGNDLLPIDSIQVYPVRYGENNQRPGLAIRAFTSHGTHARSVLWLNYWLDLPPDKALKTMCADFQGDRASEREATSVWHALMVSELFLNQRVLIHEAAHVERHARKRAERQGFSPEIHVIRLRHVVKQHDHQSMRDAIEWTCRWMVRGHWAQQWYPSKGKHEMIWIMPYVKGPEGMPFKSPLPTVGSVMR